MHVLLFQIITHKYSGFDVWVCRDIETVYSIIFGSEPVILHAHQPMSLIFGFLDRVVQARFAFEIFTYLAITDSGHRWQVEAVSLSHQPSHLFCQALIYHGVDAFINPAIEDLAV